MVAWELRDPPGNIETLSHEGGRGPRSIAHKLLRPEAQVTRLRALVFHRCCGLAAQSCPARLLPLGLGFSRQKCSLERWKESRSRDILVCLSLSQPCDPVPVSPTGWSLPEMGAWPMHSKGHETCRENKGNWCKNKKSKKSFPASGSFPVSQTFASGGQSFGVSAPARSNKRPNKT